MDDSTIIAARDTVAIPDTAAAAVWSRGGVADVDFVDVVDFVEDSDAALGSFGLEVFALAFAVVADLKRVNDEFDDDAFLAKREVERQTVRNDIFDLFCFDLI